MNSVLVLALCYPLCQVLKSLERRIIISFTDFKFDLLMDNLDQIERSKRREDNCAVVSIGAQKEVNICFDK